MSTVSKLQIVLEATTTAFDRGLRKAQDGLNAFAKQTDKIHAKMESFQKRHQGAFDAMQAIGAASAVGLVAIGAGIKATTDEAMKFESAMAEVKKVVNFESPDGIKQMRAELEELSTRVPIAFDGLAKIAAAAGQSGIAANEIVKFTEAAAKMGTAFDITAEEAGQAMAEMRTAFKMSQAEVETLADKINYLGNNSPNAAAKIMEVVQRIGPLGEIAGVSADQIAAMAASLTSVEPDVAATGLKNMMLQLVKGESLSKSAKAAFDDLGLSYTEIAKGMQTDSIGTINKVFEAIKKLPEEAQAATINDIFGSESIAVISQLINGTDTLGKHLQAMGDASKYAGSMSQEAANINDTSAAKMEMFKNATQNAKAAIGDAFLPALGALAEALLPVINGIKQFAQENPTMVTAITGIVGGVLVLGTALGAIGLAVPLVTTALGGLTAIAGLVGTAIGAISLPVVAVVAAIAALVVAGVWLYNNWDMVKAKAIEVWNAIPEYASQAWQWIQGVWSGIGEWFGGIWESVKSAVSTAIDGVKQAFFGWLSGMPAPVQEMVANIGSIFSGIATIASTAWAGITAVAKTAFSAVVAVWQGLSSAVSSAWQGIVSVATSVWNSVKSAVASAINAIKPIITSVASFFSSAWNGLVSVAQSVWNGVKAAVSAGINGAKAVLTAGVTGFAIIFNAGFNAVKTVVSTIFNAIKALVRGDINGVKTAIQSGLSQLGGIARNAMGQMVSAITSIGGRLRQAGTEIVQGLINGISSKIEGAVAKVREMASRMKNAVTSFFDINSPSRVMKQIGEWVSEGMAIGIAYKAPMAADEAKKMAENTKKAVESEMESLSRSIFITQQKIAGNPFAELTTDIAFGKYQGQDTAQLLALKEEEQRLGGILSMIDNLRKLKQDIALVGKSNIEIMEWEYENTDKYLAITREVFDTYKNANIALANRQFVENDIKKVINERSAIGKNEIDLLKHKLATEKEYLHITQTLKDGLVEQAQLKLFETKQAEAQLELAKKLYMLKNASDPLAEKKWQLSQSGMSPEQQQALLDIENQGMIADKFGKLQEGLKAGKAFTLPTFSGTGLEGAGNALASGISGMASLDKQYQEQLDIIRQARQAQLDINADYDKQEYDLKAAHEAAKRELTLSSAEGIASGLAGATKSMFGEQSKVYRAMFAVEKGVAIARSIMAIQQAIAFAAANPFPMNIGAMASVAAQTASIISNIRAVKNPVVGQAHDGIMSVPKSGTWNLEKGERVLPKHTAKALDDKLASMGNGKAINVIIHNHTGEKVQQTTDSNGDIRIIVGQELARQLPQQVNDPYSGFNKALKNNYNLERKL
ncbi:phage tail tape measure protein [Moraxella nasicaprae]|uniref:Phage tail tape measure protein n=1 Tax=Moraxella nasicaprae TaxID=2904122 RepID=A0ABY6F375_9GAMM|nr:phage tail tape measure protein [Moraxella nasicaprae]UXZ04548.1 phage tail tape measure protein [Moraxella nasicaprae]